MARPPSPILTDAELRLMKVLWSRGESTVTEILDALPDDVDLADSTIRTTLRIMEEKGYVRHTERGRAYEYTPTIEAEDARRSAIGHLVTRFFDGSTERLVLRLLEDEDLDEDDLARLRRMIEEQDGS